jgi:hypothetical protein
MNVQSSAQHGINNGYPGKACRGLRNLLGTQEKWIPNEEWNEDRRIWSLAYSIS